MQEQLIRTLEEENKQLLQQTNKLLAQVIFIISSTYFMLLGFFTEPRIVIENVRDKGPVS